MARELGRSVREAQATVDSAEFSEWIALYNIEAREAAGEHPLGRIRGAMTGEQILAVFAGIKKRQEK